MVHFIFLLLFFTNTCFSCEVKWNKLMQKTPFHSNEVRPQGLTKHHNSLILSNHYKDAKTGKESSDFLVLNQNSMALTKKLKFPPEYKHIGGLTSDEKSIYAVDFDRGYFLRLEDIGKEIIDVTPLFEVPIKGLSGLAIDNKIIAISNYILPHRYPYFADRYIRFFDLDSGSELKFSGNVLSSNYSQGLAFFRINDNLYLAESINNFDSVLSYWMTGYDYTPDTLRIYKLDNESLTIEHVVDTISPANMIEDLALNGQGHIITTDEQDYSFYEAKITNCL